MVKGVNLEITPGEIVAIVGESGAGKSTLLQLLGTLDQPDAGEILINNTNIQQLSGKKLAQFRNQHLGFVFQFHYLLPEFSVTLKHFHQIRFYDELRKHFNITALPPASPVRQSPPSQKFVQSSPTNNEFTAVAFVN